MDPVLLVKWAHILGACVLIGTGAGIAFFMMMAHRTRDVRIIAHTASVVVFADLLFTASAAVIQPMTGLALSYMVGWSLTEGWILLSIGLYVFIGALWLPVVWWQKSMREMADLAVREGTGLPSEYFSLYRRWFISGIPAFLAILGILWLMVARPSL